MPKRSSHPRQSEAVRAQWSGTLSFGLVSIPVELYPATRPSHVALRMLAPDGTPVARRFQCPDDDKYVPSEHLVRGYEYEPDRYVVISDEELEALEPDKSRDIDLRLFVPADSIDPVYFERTYFLTPGGNSQKAYRLLAAVMQRGERAGIATFVMREREYLVAIFARGGVLSAEMLRFHDQVRTLAAPRKTRGSSELEAELEKLIARHARDRFDPRKLVDSHTEGLRKLAQRKAKKRTDVIEVDVQEQSEEDQVENVDLLRLLKQSLRTGR